MEGLRETFNRARCPECGSEIILPKLLGKENVESDDPQVWCSDHGHWVGLLSETVQIIKPTTYTHHEMSNL